MTLLWLVLAIPGPRTAPAQQRQAKRPAPMALSDDIPLARRTVVPLRRPRRRDRLAVVVAAVLVTVLAVTLVFPGLVLRQPNVAGVAQPGLRPDRDGRLLGHFPYGEVAPSELVTVAPGQQLHRDAASALLAMQADARAEGVELVVLSAHRSVETQKHLFFDIKSERNQSARERAQVSAPPGYSEHSTGYAVDLGDGAAPGTNLSPGFDQTAAFAWLRQHAARYHFVLSFPRGNGQGVSYEPWHWRFEGSSDALRVFEPAQRLQR